MLALPAAEYFAWERHLRHWPPGDPLLRWQMAILCSLVTNAAFQVEQPAKPEDFLPWLQMDDERESRRKDEFEAERKVRLRLRAEQVEAIYLRTRNAKTD